MRGTRRALVFQFISILDWVMVEKLLINGKFDLGGQFWSIIGQNWDGHNSAPWKDFWAKLRWISSLKWKTTKRLWIVVLDRCSCTLPEVARWKLLKRSISSIQTEIWFIRTLTQFHGLTTRGFQLPGNRRKMTETHCMSWLFLWLILSWMRGNLSGYLEVRYF